VPRSYDFDRFPDPRRRAELARLQAQAEILLPRELASLVEVGLRPGHRFLEVGCGPGFVTGAVAAQLSGGEAVGLDASRELLAVARDVVAPVHPNITFVEGRAEALPFPAGSFDFAYARLLFQHLPDPAAALAEARRVLRRGGRLSVLDIDDGWLSLHPPSAAFERLSRRAVEAKAAQGGDRLVGRKLAGLLQGAGFSDVRLRVEGFSSLEVGLGPFLQLTTRFKAALLDPVEARELLAQLDGDLSATPAAVGLAGIFVATGAA
jgi:ubiquinone/menaquinone biosynthesis C-methylase UbiE